MPGINWTNTASGWDESRDGRGLDRENNLGGQTERNRLRQSMEGAKEEERGSERTEE